MKRRRSSSFFDECLGKLFADLIDTPFRLALSSITPPLPFAVIMVTRNRMIHGQQALATKGAEQCHF